MAQIKRFEDLEIWQLARVFCKELNAKIFAGNFKNDFTLMGQLRGSSGSIMDNIAEGFERGGNKEFVQFLSVSKGSAGESRSQIYRAFDNSYLSEEELFVFLKKSVQLSTKISNMMSYLKNSDLKGFKFK